ncbi:MAG: DNA-directed RNA polymerase subunit RPC12/RpoP [Verrucomicrobiales bacterium]|jgi:DNA-directed RNA polymerase subunit RPC12/RpoP
MAKGRVTIDCHHCGKRTVIDLMEEMSTQRCSKCGLRLNSVNTSGQERRRKKVSGDPMLNRYEESEQSETLRRKRRYFSSRRWRILKVILLLLVFAILISTAYIVITNPMGMHRRW